MSKDVVLNDRTASETFGATLGTKLKGGEVIALSGDLGSGKTTIIKSIVKGSGSLDLATSPTFTVCNTYKGPKFSMYHYDFYRLNDVGIIKFAVDEHISDNSSVVLIEWAQLIQEVLPPNTINIKIEVTGENSRKLLIDYPTSLAYLFE